MPFEMSEESAREWAEMDEERKKRALAVLDKAEAMARRVREEAAKNVQLFSEVFGDEFLEKYSSPPKQTPPD